MGDFEQRFWAAILEGTHRFVSGGGATPWAPQTTPWKNPLRSRIKDVVYGAVTRRGLSVRLYRLDDAVEALTEIRPLLDGFARISERLADERSRELLVRLLALRVLGQWHVEPPVTAERFWAIADQLRVDGEVPGDSARSPYGHPLPRIRVTAPSGETVELYAHPLQICEFFGLEQYAFRAGPTIKADPGDVVVDGGGGWGDTALYFAAMVGESGRVVCFEFVPENLTLLKRNLGLNGDTGARVQVVEQAVWNRSEQTVTYPVGDAGMTTVLGETGGATATAVTASIDDILAGSGGRADFIKLDVEGAELQALQGAEQTLRRWRPKLAVSVYHHVEDLVLLLDHIDELDLGYRFHLGHIAPGIEETILFAVAPRD